MALSKTTKDHDEIKQWAERRGAVPGEVASTESKGGPGILRFMFPKAPNHNDGALKEIEWDDFFEKFDANGLELLYQDVTVEGAESNFNKLIYPENESSSVKKAARKTAAKPGARKGAATKTAAKKSAGKRAGGKTAVKKAAPAKKTAAKKAAPAKKTPAKAPAKKAPAKKTPAKTVAKKSPAKKTAAKKATAKKAVPAKKTPAKKGAVRGLWAGAA